MKKNFTTTIFECVFSDDNQQMFDFCMCNPPFYTNIQELLESRSPARPTPKNGFTGSPHELITEGGELQFCRKIIEESKIYKNKILIFTTMVGHKYNLKELVLDLKAEDIEHTTTEFCQGRVTRWGLAWTYEDVKLSEFVAAKQKSRKKNVPITFSLPELPVEKNSVTDYFEKVKAILQNLKIIFKIISKRRNEVNLSVIAHENTWSNQRRKRRLLKQSLETQAKQIKLASENHISEGLNPSEVLSNEHDNHSENNETEEEKIAKQLFKTEQESVVQGFMKLYVKKNHPNIEMEYLSGSAGKEGLHQIMQYIKNNWK